MREDIASILLLVCISLPAVAAPSLSTGLGAHQSRGESSRVLPEALIRVEARRPAASTAVGRVMVEIMLRPDGDVDKANAIAGPSALREVAEDAARQWKFLVDDETIRAVGVITFEFTRRNRVSRTTYTFTFQRCCP